ncbi:2-C-methyl-D-erythritol 4-phosphate cytidylyltransferase [bacterium]|nr:2-C-methyl-D-erythritol 4-phosphate cytidylyltransferase [bacterium]
MKNAAIIVSAGSGKRMKSLGKKVKKQYLPLANQPILIHTLKKFEELKEISEIILVLPKGEINYFKECWIKKYNFLKIKKIIAGGSRRQISVSKGLKNVSKDCKLIVIHDGVRPLVRKEIIIRAIKAASKYGASIVGVPVKETIKTVKNKWVKSTLKREDLWSIQTPQVFKQDLIKKAYLKAEREKIYANDDAQLVENLGKKIRLVLSNYENIKITTPHDLIIAEEILKRRKKIK